AQILLLAGLVGTEIALVLARKAMAEVVLQETGGADDDGCLAYLVQNLAKLLDDGRGEIALQMLLDDPRILLANLVQRPVLLIHDVIEVILPPELVDHVGAQKVGVRDGDLLADVRS